MSKRLCVTVPDSLWKEVSSKQYFMEFSASEAMQLGIMAWIETMETAEAFGGMVEADGAAILKTQPGMISKGIGTTLYDISRSGGMDVSALASIGDFGCVVADLIRKRDLHGARARSYVTALCGWIHENR